MAKKTVLKFTSKEIEEKEFEVLLRGYHPEKVDSYLDEIVEDYRNFELIEANLKNEIDDLKNEKNKILIALKSSEKQNSENIEKIVKLTQIISSNPAISKAINDDINSFTDINNFVEKKIK